MPSKKTRGWGWRWGWCSIGGLIAMLLKTGQTTCYSVFDDGDQEIGVDKAYTVQAAGAYAGNADIEVAHYAAATIAFVNATSKITDSANGLATVLTGDTIVVKGSTSNDGTYAVATGGVAGEIVTTEALVDESAAAMVSLYKRTAHSNNAVDDDSTGLQWSRYSSNGEKVGVASFGFLNWYDVATRFAIYAGANTVSCIAASNIFRVIGGAALTQFHVGDMIMCAGFANAVNNLPNYYVTTVTVNGADLDITVDPGNEVLTAEGAVGDTIYLVCRSCFNYMAGARTASLSNLTDWRVPNDIELLNLRIMAAPGCAPDPVAFPGWNATGYHQASTTNTNNVGWVKSVRYSDGSNAGTAKSAAIRVALVRG